jgi:hypothetical protein
MSTRGSSCSSGFDVLALEGDSVVRWFEGNFTEYEAFRHRELDVAADQPHWIRYKRLAG